MTSTRIWIIASVVLYMVGMLAVGYWASRRVKSEKDFIVAGGQFGWLLSIGTIFATWFGAETCMGSSGTAFQKGILGVIADPFGAGLCLVLAGIFFASFFRAHGYETIIDFFEKRYGRKVAAFFSFLYIPVYLGWVGAQLLAFGYILNALTGLPLLPSILISTAVVLIYTYAGGLWADALTDFFQMIILIVGLLVICPILFHDMGGWASLQEKVSPETFYFFPRSHDVVDWLNYLQAWMIVGLGSLPAQDLFQRMMAARNATVSKWSSIIAGFLYVGFGMLPVLLGIYGRCALPENSGESILIDLALRYLPPALIALFIGALLSAIMSSADSALLAPASIIGHNLIPYRVPGLSDQMKLNWCKWSVPVLGILSLILALYFKNIYKLCQESWGILLTGIVAPMIAGVYWTKANSIGATAGAIAGVVTWLGLKIFLPGDYPHNLGGFLASSLVLVVVSLATAQERVLQAVPVEIPEVGMSQVEGTVQAVSDKR